MQPKRIIPLGLATIILLALGAPPAFAVDSNAEVENQVPAVDTITVSATVNPTAGSTTAVAVTIAVSDANGYQDIDSVQFTVIKPDGTSVHVASQAAASNDDGSGTSQTYSGSFNMQFHDDPAIGASTYKVRATATDVVGATSEVTEATFSYTKLAALGLSASSMSFGALAPGARSASQTLTVTNQGNVEIDIQTSGSALAAGIHSIPVASMKYDLVSTAFGAEQSLTASPFTNAGFNLAKGASSQKATYWQLAVPSASSQYMPAGEYAGTVALSAIESA